MHVFLVIAGEPFHCISVFIQDEETRKQDDVCIQGKNRSLDRICFDIFRQKGELRAKR